MAVVVVALVAGCGGGDDGNDNTTPTTTPTTTTPTTTTPTTPTTPPSTGQQFQSVFLESQENVATTLGTTPTCTLRVRVRNPQGRLVSVVLVYNGFDSARTGIGTALVTGLAPANSTQTFEGTWVAPGAQGSFIPCSRIASFALDTTVSSAP